MLTSNLRTSAVRGARCFHRSAVSHSFISNLFGNKEVKQKKDIIKEQDDYEIDPNAKIVILGEKNSPDYVEFSVKTHMPDFTIDQWKDKTLKRKAIENAYTKEEIIAIISQAHNDLKGQAIKFEDYGQTDLHDLKFRFALSKAVHQKLGFELSDYVLSRTHDVKSLFDQIEKMVTARATNERNPNDIAIRAEDFTAPNVYFNEQSSEFEQQRKLEKLVEEARKAL